MTDAAWDSQDFQFMWLYLRLSQVVCQKSDINDATCDLKSKNITDVGQCQHFPVFI